jgi:membrane protein required for beta-lactamase induction
VPRAEARRGGGRGVVDLMRVVVLDLMVVTVLEGLEGLMEVVVLVVVVLVTVVAVMVSLFLEMPSEMVRIDQCLGCWGSGKVMKRGDTVADDVFVKKIKITSGSTIGRRGQRFKSHTVDVRTRARRNDREGT